jgi:hypothetical protein
MKTLIKGTFIDEISHDIPHQNWGAKEWRKDFEHMKAMGINTVILIRSGYKKFITYPSAVLISREGCYKPPIDLVQLYLELADEFEFDFYFGLYDSGKYWVNNLYQEEVAINQLVIDEVWQRYSHYKSFKGWYITQEVSRKIGNIIDIYAALGKHCKSVSNNLPCLISPYMDGVKNISQYTASTTKAESITAIEHHKQWSEILDGIKEAVDIVAFQDGHLDYEQLSDFFSINKELADKYGLQCWTNAETFDRDMPIKFLPIKWEKLLLKLNAAAAAGIDHAITFEFSHFMSPQSTYLQAGNLYNRYLEYKISQ